VVHLRLVLLFFRVDAPDVVPVRGNWEAAVVGTEESLVLPLLLPGEVYCPRSLVAVLIQVRTMKAEVRLRVVLAGIVFEWEGMRLFQAK